MSLSENRVVVETDHKRDKGTVAGEQRARNSGPMSDSPAILSRPIILPVDGRQSAVASGIQRGVRRLFSELGHVTLPEFTLANGRRADLIALAPDGAADRRDQIERGGFPGRPEMARLRGFCDWFYFAVPETVPFDILPEDRGLIVADSFAAIM